MRPRRLAAVVGAAMAIAMAGSAALAEEKKAPEYGTYEFQFALETGSLPSKYFEASKVQSAVPAPVIQVGGIAYRVGVDTP